MSFTYYTPMDIASLFRTTNDVGQFIEHMIDIASDIKEKSQGDDSFIPPVVYSHKGRSFNFDYNFMVHCLAEWVNDRAVEGDFKFTEVANASAMKNGIFLVVGILEEYYGVVRINNRTIDVSKYKSQRTVSLDTRFYNLIVIKNGEKYKRFSAVHFSASEVKKLIDENAYHALVMIADSSDFEQVVFGISAYKKFVAEMNLFPQPVFE